MNSNVNNIDNVITNIFNEFIEMVNSQPFNQNIINNNEPHFDVPYFDELQMDENSETEFYENDVDFQMNQRIRNNSNILRNHFEFSNNYNSNSNSNLNIVNNSNNSNNSNINRNRNINLVNNLNMLNNNVMFSFTNILLDMLNGFENYQEGDLFDDVKITISQDEFDKLNHKKVDENCLKENILNQCSICLDEFKLLDEIVILKCNHIYHNECIGNWLLKCNIKCPSCRKDVRET